MIDLLNEPWPWYVAGPLIGLMVPLFLMIGNKSFGISSSLRHVCAMCFPGKISYFRYEWKTELWNVFFVIGLVIGGFITAKFFTPASGYMIDLNPETREALKSLGIERFEGFVPADIFSWENLMTYRGVVFVIIGGFLVGFGTRYANGCTSGHSITGLAHLQWSSLVATIGFFIGGLLMTHLLLPVMI
jgi:uncharacterized membrane protein YedE/YeeE